MANISFNSPYLNGVELTSSEGWFFARKLCAAPTAARASAIESMGVDAWIEKQLNPDSLTESAQYNSERKAIFPSCFIKAPAGKTLDKNFYDTYHGGNRHKDYDVATYVLEAAFHRSWASEKQLQAKIAQFWADTVAASIEKSPDGFHDYVNVLFDGALGKYSDLLWELINTRTMNLFLDNITNTQFALNENMGREIMELHTWGTDKGYSQDDVVAVAKLMTGFKGNYDGVLSEARPDLHFFGPITVCGRTLENGGSTAEDMYATLRELIDYLTHDRGTAMRISRRLIQYFVGEHQDWQGLQQKMADAYLEADTDIRPVLRILFKSAEFRASGGQTIQRPASVLASLFASGKLKLKNTNNLSDMSVIYTPLYRVFMMLNYYSAGMPYTAPATDGYPLSPRAWINSTNVNSISKFSRFTNYISTWDGNAKDSFARWAEPIDWADALGITVGKTSVNDAARKVFVTLTGYSIENEPNIVGALATFAKNTTPEAVSGDARVADSERISSDDEVKRLVEATLTAPHFLLV
ncbi:DUF1800 family protein [Rothia terrae]|uniref:DUF1800 family protein n=1 Tax=Rothia terrae TaxID=396015 RepID=A0A7H2BCZ7_9MICC|nr:DUF1800 family protein [Rothia terrae]QNV37543.1 DUF1800 family protein [Rothia terrae]